MNESITVSALNRYTKTLIERDEILSSIWVEGEITGYTVHPRSGHVYFSLRDRDASVRAVLFARYTPNLRFIPKEGLYVIADCKVTLYERDGSFQLTVYNLYPKGRGDIAEQVSAARRSLQQDGLLAEERKRPLPVSPSRIAVITSGSSAALQDILSVVGRRNPFVSLRVFSVSVQGITAASEIIKAIGIINDDPCYDLVIIARGGGSAEDLWYFNDELLARSAASLKVPFLSAVGHETDTTLLDEVADLRAATPSAAAELAVRNVAERYEMLSRQLPEMLGRIRQRLQTMQEICQGAERRLALSVQTGLETRLQRLEERQRLLAVVDPMNVLLRGYALAAVGERTVTSITQLQDGTSFTLRMHDGSANCRVISDEE